jgi:type II secretory pathway predicted ATPase ExeA
MPTHFLGLQDAAVLPTRQYQLTARVIDDLVRFQAIGVIHGPAGAGKTFAVSAQLERLRESGDQVVTVSLSFPSKPSPLAVAAALVEAVTGEQAPRRRNRFQLTAHLLGVLASPARLIVVDEAQRLNGECIELLRHLHDHELTSFAVLLVGGDGCWQVLSREPMLRSRVFRRLPFTPLRRDQVPTLIRGYHPIYAQAGDELLLEIDDAYAHGSLRDWATFTLTAATLCREDGREHVTLPIAANACALLGGGLGDDD